MAEKVSHSALAAPSAPFSLAGGYYSLSAAGTIAIGADSVELQRLAGGQWITADSALRWSALDKGGTRSAALPAGTYRWSVPLGAGHSANTSITGQ